MIVETVADIPLAPTACSVAIGTFDGVHRGHRQLLEMMVADAHANGRAAVVLTFDPHPLTVLRPELAPRLLMTPEQRSAEIAALGADRLVVVRFTAAFAAAPASRFARHELVECLGARRVFIGFNFSFGRQGEGTPERLSELGRKLGFDVVVLPAVISDGRVVSSSAIRKAVMAGEMETATAMLGRPYSLQGTVVHGDARGRRLGFPTANVALADDLVCPRTGVYLTRVRWQDVTAFGVANFGQRPTFAGREIRLEVHLLDRSDDWYGRQVAVEFVHLLRGERQFRNADELSAQIAADVATARSLIAANGDGGLQAAATVIE